MDCTNIDLHFDSEFNDVQQTANQGQVKLIMHVLAKINLG